MVWLLITCQNQGFLLDAPDVHPLVSPWWKSLHCLLDVPQCIESPFHILEPPSTEGGNYSVGWQVDDNTKLLEAGRALGSVELGCTTCPGNGTQKMGVRAEVKGKVKSLGDPISVLMVESVMALEGMAEGCKDMPSMDSDDNSTSEGEAPPSDDGSGATNIGLVAGAVILLGSFFL